MAQTFKNDISRAIVLGVEEWFTKNWDGHATQYTNYVDVVNADLETMTYDSMGNLKDAALKPEGQAVQFGKVEQAYETKIKNKTYSNGIEFTMESKEYDKYKVTVEAKAKELARTMRKLEEKIAIAPYNDAFTVNLADGVPLISNSHPLFNTASAVNDNLVTGYITPDNIKQGTKNFHRFKDHQGGEMVSFPEKLFTHFVNMQEVEETMLSTNKAYEFSNTANKLPSMKPVYSRYLTSETAWFLMDDEYKHVKMQFYMGNRNKMDWDENFYTKSLEGTCVSMMAAGAVPYGGVGIVGSDGT